MSLRLMSLRHGSRALSAASRCRSRRHFSTGRCLLSQELPFPLDEGQFEQLKQSLMARDFPVLREAPTTTPTALLETTLHDFMPHAFQPPPTGNANSDLVQGYRAFEREGGTLQPVPFSYHLIYFPPQTSLSQLLPDSTDPAQSPGDPFDRRMWAGGSIELFKPSSPWFQSSFALNQSEHSSLDMRAACVERISDVQLKGKGDTQKIFVTLERRIGGMKATGTVADSEAINEHDLDKGRLLRFQADDASVRDELMQDENVSLIEKRNLVFMNNSKMPKPDPKSPPSPPKVLKASGSSEFTTSLVPNANLLFRFSALTYNAHRIHLDREYCRSIEGHRNLVVHGPLSLVLMCENLRGHLEGKCSGLKKPLDLANMKSQIQRVQESGGRPEVISSIEYRNLAPLFADEEMHICLRKKDETAQGSAYEVWVENSDHSMCVKGTAKTVLLEGAKL